ncbi:MAG: MBL fold metallo-hydrolase [Bacteroidaceae bacterium]|nr:MBL fold metallo-hydrolase [Bacteroidaceae bacterium]
MLTIKTFPVNILEENCYVVSDESKDCIIIDCGAQYTREYKAIALYISLNGLKPVHLLNTHLHFDHAWGNKFIAETYGLQTEASSRDVFLYENFGEQVKLFMGMQYDEDFPCSISRDLDEGDYVEFGTHQLQVIATPGHTPGGRCFYCPEENVLFSGDSLFKCSIGRSDLPRSNGYDLVEALRGKILTLPFQTVVYPGHGPTTTIGEERTQNPYL